jgi:beta-lactamase regulating signal transducer with metallopeptidase domain
MMFVLIDAALRSLFVGLMVAAGLRAFRIRNIFVQKTALGLVLAAAMAMPLLKPMVERLDLLPASAAIVLPSHPMTLLEELQARIQAKAGSSARLNPLATPVPGSSLPQTGKALGPAAGPASGIAAGPAPDRAAAERSAEGGRSNVLPGSSQGERATGSARAAGKSQPQPRHSRFTFSLSFLILSIYLGVTAVLLLRLAVGLVVTIRLWLNAKPVSTRELPEVAAGVSLRASTQVCSPLTVGSVVLLPADYKTWDREKLRIVLAHERSHIYQCDFYLQLLAGLYAAVVWFSPLGWWLKRELAELGEAISDRAGIEEARSRASYAQILLEFAAAPRSAMLGVAMARRGSLSRRIERLLNDHAFRQCFAGRKRALLAVALVPMAFLAATAVVRVEAASQPLAGSWVAPSTRPVSSQAAGEPEAASTTGRPATENPPPVRCLWGSHCRSLNQHSRFPRNGNCGDRDT